MHYHIEVDNPNRHVTPPNPPQPSGEPPAFFLTEQGKKEPSQSILEKAKEVALSFEPSPRINEFCTASYPFESPLLIGQPGMNNEAVIAAHPSNPNILIATYNHVDVSQPAISYSLDGGKTWNVQNIAITIPGANRFGDSMVVILESGRWVVSQLGYNTSNLALGGTYIAYSDNQGKTWTLKMMSENNNGTFNDKPGIGAKGNKIVACHTTFANSDLTIFCRISNDAGETWSNQIKIPEILQYNTAAQPFITSDGKILVSSFNSTDSSLKIQLATIHPDNSVTIQSLAEDPKAPFGGWMADITENSHGHLNVTWGDGAIVWLQTSTNKGQTWSKNPVFSAEGLNFFNPMSQIGSYDRLVMAAYAYDPVTKTMQLVVRMQNDPRAYRIGPEYPVVGEIPGLGLKVAAGDYGKSTQLRNLDGTPLGAVAFGHTFLQPLEPGGEITNDVAATIVWTEVHAISQDEIFFNNESNFILGELDIFNEGLVDGTLQVTWQGSSGAPILTGLPTSVAVTARSTTFLQFAANMSGFEEDEAIYFITFTDPDTGKKVTKKVTLYNEAHIIYIPLIFK